jgi:hypothetical protein
MSDNPYNLVDDQPLLDEFKQHFKSAKTALEEAVKRGEKTFFLNLLGDLEDIEAAITAVEKGEMAIAFVDGEEVPLGEILSDEIPPTPETTCCPSCGSTDLKDVIVKPFEKVANQCLHCQTIFEPNYFVGDLETEDLE